MNHLSKRVLSGIVLGAMLAPIAAAQIGEPGSQAVNLNAKAGPRAAHAPALWSRAATGRSIAFQNEAFNGTHITDPQPETDLVAQLNASIIETSFLTLNTGLQIIEQLYLAELADQSGQGVDNTPVIDSDSLDDFFGDVSGDGGGGTDTSSTDGTDGSTPSTSDNLDDFFGDISGGGPETRTDGESLETSDPVVDEDSLGQEPLDDFFGDISDE